MSNKPASIYGIVDNSSADYSAFDELFSGEAAATTDARQGAIEFYNSLAEAYNAAPVTGIVVVALPKTKNRVGNASNVLENRGLVRGLDFHIAIVRRDAADNLIPVNERTVAIKRLTSSLMRKSR